MRDLGTLGEHTFQLWCSEAGLIPNTSSIDKTGWDFFLESPEDFRSLKNEIHSSPIKFLVQVKATNKRKRKLAIPLSNLWRMTTLLMPTYYAFIEFDDDGKPENAFLVHVGNELITKVLKRLHLNELKIKPAELHKLTLTINYGDENKLEQLNGECLLRHLNAPVQNNVAVYIENKKKHLESAGYEGYPYKVKFSVLEEDYLKLIDSSLGLNNTIEVFSITGTKDRFSLPSNLPLFKEDTATLSIEAAPFSSGQVFFKEDNFSVGLSFDVEIYLPFPTLELPAEHQKFRVLNEYFDFLFYTELRKINFEFHIDKTIEIRMFIKILKLMKLVHSECLVELKMERLDSPYYINLAGIENEFIYYEELLAAQNALKIMNAFDLSETVDVELKHIAYFSESYKIFSHLLNEGSNQTSRVVIPNFPAEFDIAIPVVTISTCMTRIGKFVFVLIYSIEGVYVKGQDDKLISINERRLEKMSVIEGDHYTINIKVNELESTISDKYDKNGNQVLICDRSEK